MNRLEALNSLKFKGKTKAVAIKFDHNYLRDGSSIAIGYNEVDIKSAGKVKASIVYDGSTFPKDRKFGQTIDHYINNNCEWRSSNLSAYRMGSWFIIPVSAITDEFPMDFWIGIAKEDFKLDIPSYTGNDEAQRKALIDLIDNAEVKELTVAEWNEAKLSLLSETERQHYTTK